MSIKVGHENSDGNRILTFTCSLVGNFPFYMAVREKQPNTVLGIDVWWGYTYLGIIKQFQAEHIESFSKPSATLTFDWGHITTELSNLRSLKNLGKFRSQLSKISPKFCLTHYKPKVCLLEINDVSYKLAETQTTVWSIQLGNEDTRYYYL